MNTSDIKSTARKLLDAYDNGKLADAPSASHPGFDWTMAYDVVSCIADMRRARGERSIGRKIGFTNRNIWAEYGATSPIWSHVYDSTVILAKDNRAKVSLRGSVAPKLEPEIAFKLRAPLPTACNDPLTILQSVAWLAPSFEIVDCHFAGWKFKAADSAADQSFHWRLVVGDPYHLNPADLAKIAAQIRDCTVELSCNGNIRDRGVGSNALGHPALALVFLADILATQPKFSALATGEIITTGTLTAALAITPGEMWTSEISGLPVSPLTVEFKD
jgi:2-oxo-3-hexenedioate decarboxylase